MLEYVELSSAFFETHVRDMLDYSCNAFGYVRVMLGYARVTLMGSVLFVQDCTLGKFCSFLLIITYTELVIFCMATTRVFQSFVCF